MFSRIKVTEDPVSIKQFTLNLLSPTVNDTPILLDSDTDPTSLNVV